MHPGGNGGASSAFIGTGRVPETQQMCPEARGECLRRAEKAQTCTGRVQLKRGALLDRIIFKKIYKEIYNKTIKVLERNLGKEII